MAYRNTRQRQLVLNAVRNRHDHPTADEVYLDVRMADNRISRGTVYRNLGLLAQSGQITQVESSPADRYDLRLDRHYHLRCTCCGKVWDAPVDYAEALDQQVAAATGFLVQRHETMFDGICADCQRQQDSLGQARIG